MNRFYLLTQEKHSEGQLVSTRQPKIELGTMEASMDTKQATVVVSLALVNSDCSSEFYFRTLSNSKHVDERIIPTQNDDAYVRTYARIISENLR